MIPSGWHILLRSLAIGIYPKPWLWLQQTCGLADRETHANPTDATTAETDITPPRKSSCASPWTVSHHNTARLNTEFYRYMLQHKGL
jgi:hypothetical protein